MTPETENIKLVSKLFVNFVNASIKMLNQVKIVVLQINLFGHLSKPTLNMESARSYDTSICTLVSS